VALCATDRGARAAAPRRLAPAAFGAAA
jgi:hypothetical protein